MADRSASSEDYVFRYPLRQGGAGVDGQRGRVTEMLAAHLRHILNLVVPVAGGQEQKIDGFKLLSHPEKVHRLFPEGREPGCEEESPPGYQDTRNAALYEPRVDFIRAQLESLLSVIDLEEKGRVVSVDGFRLKDLEDWLVPSSGDPVEVFGHGASRCDADCVFCYNRGNPPAVALRAARRSAAEEEAEMSTRLKYFSPQSGRALFPSLGCTYEVLLHPGIMDVLRGLRLKTAAPLRLTTNGCTLTREKVRQLAELRPLYLYLSLNSASPSRRHMLMRDASPETAIGSLPLLREAGIPYATVIVPWPLPSLGEMLDDLEGTIRYADAHDTHLVQVNLPGYTEHFSSKKLFELDEVWSAVVARVRELRGGTSAPIVVMPSLYEENLCEEHWNRPRIIGLVKNSPAARAGLEPGDEIVSVNGLGAATRPQTRRLLGLVRESGPESAVVAVKRQGQQLDLTLRMGDFAYPYSEGIDQHLGIVMMGTGFAAEQLERLRDLLEARRARRVLFLSSTLVRPLFEQALAESPLFAGGRYQVEIEVPANRFFGGNVFMGDLLVVQDFIDCIREHLQRGGARPDLVVIPSSPFSLGPWKRDLTGRVYLDIEREVGIPVALLHCDTAYD